MLGSIRSSVWARVRSTIDTVRGQIYGMDEGTRNTSHTNDLQRVKSFESPQQTQHQSPLFGLLPPEIRDLIYEYVFAEYEDMSRSYDFHTCYRRPGYMAPRKTDTSFLETCQAIYREAWYLPWTFAQHTFYLAWADRKPDKTTDIARMTRTCALIERICMDASEKRKHIPHVQVFAQLCYIENGDLAPILEIPCFMPRAITITIRHTDFWSWEADSPLQIDGWWVSTCRMPASVTLVRMQIESLQRKKEQIDYIADRVRNEWYWQRTDGIHLVATNSHSETWVGSSIWGGERWVRDEDINEPERLRYSVATISFQPVDPEEDLDGHELRRKYHFEEFNVPSEILDRTHINIGMPAIVVEPNPRGLELLPNGYGRESFAIHGESD